MHKVYVNIDTNSDVCPFLNILAEQPNICTEMLYPFVDQYRNTHVTDILFNPFCQGSSTETDVVESISDLYEIAQKNGIKNEFLDFFKGQVELYRKHNIDPYGVWIDRCRDNGQNPWLSFRMNDVHALDVFENEVYNAFYLTAVKNGWTLGPDYGYYGRAYDYIVPEIRKRMLDYIREQLTKYDVYGVEFDFMRECQCVSYLTHDNEICINAMTTFMRDAKKVVTEAEKIHGHEIKICVRLLREIDQNLFYGLDPVTWADEGLVDVINPTPRWSASDSGIPVEEWKKAIPNTEIVAGIETLLKAASKSGEDNVIMSSAIARGHALSFLDAGSDGIYFYNYFINSDVEHTIETEPEAPQFSRNLSLISSCGDAETIWKHPVRYVIVPQEQCGFARLPKLWKPLPVKLDDGAAELEIRTGKVPENKKIAVIIGIENGFDGAEIEINGVKCSDWKEVDLSYIPGVGIQPKYSVNDNTEYRRCVIDHSVLADSIQKIKVKSQNGNAVLNWVEIDVI